jgi:ribosomal protein S18 acetylase RimI-like enzyme
VSIDLRPASSLPAGELAALFTRAYEGYFVPLQLDEAALAFMVRTFDLDLDAGLVAFDGEEPVGLVNLGVRGERGWIGGLGVVPAARRKGVGRTLMDAVHERARSLGVHEVTLEVIEANDAAFRLYDELGYDMVRWLEIGSLEPDSGEMPAEGDWHAAHERIRAARSTREPWQRDDETLAHCDDLRGLTTDTSAAVYRAGADGRVVVMQFAGGDTAARETLESLRALGPVSIFNVPEDDPLAAAFKRLGCTVALRQRELRLSL